MSENFLPNREAFFRFIGEYQDLISKHVPGNYGFEYVSRIYMEPVWEHLAMVAAATPPRGRILEIGCGRGHFSAWLSKQGFSVDGLEVKNPQPGDDFLHNQDTSTINHYPNLWAESQQRYGCRCTYYDGVNMPYDEAAFDTVLFYASYEHVPVPAIADVTAESFRVLKPGGKAFVFRCPSDWAWKEHFTRIAGLGAHEKLYGKGEIIRLLEGAGYKIDRFSRSDFFPGYLGPLQGVANALWPLLRVMEKILLLTPVAFIFHHFEISFHKPENG